MKALQLKGIGRLELVALAAPRPGPDQLLVRTGAAVLCTSDLNDIRENLFGIRLPMVMGHEGAGTVAGVGENVRGFTVGDRVATHPVHPCGQCGNCRRGIAHLCSAMGHFGLNMQGTFAEHYLARADRARKVPPDSLLSWPAGRPAGFACIGLEATNVGADLPGADRILPGQAFRGKVVLALEQESAG